LSDTPLHPLTRNFRLGEWLVQPTLNTVSRRGKVVRLRPKVMDVLVLLAEHAGEVVPKEAILDTVWAKKFLADSALSRAVFELREALGDEAQGSTYVETIPKRGYRLVSPVGPVPETPPSDEKAHQLLAHGSQWWIAAAAVALVVLASLLWFALRGRPARPENATTTKAARIVVLPFENLGRPEDDYFAAGITDEITGRLASVQGLAVISPSTALQYARTKKPTTDIARELTVDYLLTGTVRWNRVEKHADRVRITPRLVRATDDTQVWAEVYDREIEDIFQLQSEIAQSVMGQVGGVMVEPAAPGPAERPTTNIEAYQAYLRGLSHWTMDARSERDLRLALAMFERAVELDPNFALAHAETARLRSVLYHFGFERTEANRRKATTEMDLALTLEPGSAAVHLVCGLHRYWCYRDYPGALEELRIARNGLGATAELLEAEALVLRRMGRWDEAIQRFEKALDLNQRAWVLAFNVGDTLAFLRRYEEAQRLFGRAISLAPDEPDSYGYQAATFLLWKGALPEARRTLEAISQPHQAPAIAYWFRQELCEGRFQAAFDRVSAGDFTVVENSLMWRPREFLLAQAHRFLGRAGEARSAFEAARALAERALRDRPDDFRLHGTLGLSLAGLGHKDEAIAAALRATELCPLSKDALSGSAALLDLAQVYAVVGDPKSACAQLGLLLSVPSQISVPLLELDPSWAPLRTHPCYRALLNTYGR
jgi:TolB-like protein/DNA-binding winged helix-turn-helix (wHTH) protein/tetratricopeptide (TPR) repeat protein